VFKQFKLSVFDGSGNLLGSVEIACNLNADLDQFIGLRSDVAFARARFEHDAPGFGVAIDDLSFSAIPEPAALSWVAGGVAMLLSRRRLRRC
jgi:hypothetical protein